MYDKNNVFFKILNKEIPATVVYEDEVCLAFNDINPKSKIHVLVISKGLYRNFTEFANCESAETIQKFFSAVAKIADKLGIADSGYRILSNIGSDANQEVQHFHLHILGGEPLDGM